jgi:diguanylate cyclase
MLPSVLLAPVSASAARSAARLVIVDDEPVSTAGLVQFLREAGYAHVVGLTAKNKRLQALRDEHPDLVLVDLACGDETAFALLQALQTDRQLRHVPVVVLCAQDDVQDRLRALGLGVANFLVKPVQGQELLLRLRNLLAAKAYRDQLAHTDPITGLPNRDLLLLRTDWALKQALRHGHVGAVLHIGLDRFQQFNNAFGPSVGDDLLHAVADRLVNGLRESDMVIRSEQDLLESPALDAEVDADGSMVLARASGDEFSVLLPRLVRPQDAGLVAQRMVDSLAAPFEVAGQELFVSCRVGIAVFPGDGTDKNSVLQRADMAMRSARGPISTAGPVQGSVVRFDSAALNNQAMQRLRLDRELRQALAGGELRLHYQPQVDAQSGQICGAEALVRWLHPQRGLLAPAEFLEVAEEIGLIDSLGDWVLQEALRQWVVWHQQGWTLAHIGVNVSGLQLRQADLVDKIRAALAVSGASPQALCLELTETAIIDAHAQVAQTLQAIRQLGVRLALDDFGTGYSSLTYLRRFEIDELKIDRSFVADCDGHSTQSRATAAITAAIVVMARGLGLRVVAEGVETAPQLAFIRAQGADSFQGYLFSKPVPAEAFAALLAAQPPGLTAPASRFTSTAPAAPLAALGHALAA